MNSNPIPSTLGQITILAGRMVGGLTALGTTLGITQVTAAGLQASLTAFTTSDNAFNSARSAQQTAFNTFHVADDALTAWLGDVRAVLTTHFGTRWNSMWAQAGFVTVSTAVPSTIDDRLALALRVIAFFTANPGYEAASLGVTAAHGTALRTAAVTTQAAVAAASTALKQKQAARDTAQAALIAPMRMLIGILTGILASDDPRWQAFGLNIPASDSTPGQPQNLAVAPSAQSAVKAPAADTVTVLATCDAVPLALRYRWRMRISGVQNDYTLAASTTEPMAMIANVPVSLPVEIIVQAVNGGLQGMASEPVVFTPTALGTPAAPKPAPAAAAFAKKPANGNGKGNGHTLHSRSA